MIAMHKQAKRVARWVVSRAMGSGLAQDETGIDAEAPRDGLDTAAYDEPASLAALARRAAAEGCVLLTNDGTLPLSPANKVAVFGRCQLDWFYMGYGSGGDVRPPYVVNLIDGLDAACVTYDRVLAEVYRSWCSDDAHAADHGFWGHWPTHRPEMPVSPSLAQASAAGASTAIVVIGRSAGESMDLLLAEGGYYLTKEERALLRTTTDAFEHVVVVLNTGNVCDLSWIDEFCPSAVLLAWQGGMEAGHAVADVLYGRINPSGRLAATSARSYDAYPGSGTFGDRHTVSYDEGVFVGYRHFATNDPDAVQFAFGHGMSYTTFTVELLSVILNTDEAPGAPLGLSAHVRATNTGSRAGQEVVHLWCRTPRGEIPKPLHTLVAFGKTDVLDAGQSQELELTCDLKTLSSFDEQSSAFVLESGGYVFGVGDAAHVVENPTCSVTVGERVVVEQCTPLCTTSKELRERILAHLVSLDAKADGPETNESAEQNSADPRTTDVDSLVKSLSTKDLASLTLGEGFMNSRLGVPGNAGAFGGVTPTLRACDIPPVICADGPSGARLARHCSLLPCATTLACTANPSLVRDLYALAGKEVHDNGVDVLLAPGMNIQRNPLCGRNFEYFSEDPLVSGLMASAVVEGLAQAGVTACPKHFACNNQELRRNRLDARVDERTLREIYLRGFEICVRRAHPRLIMTSYNKVNGVWSHYNYDLVTTVLRGEWGFDGVVITDWWMRRARSPEFPELHDNAYRIRAGVDMLMPGTPRGVRNVERRELEAIATRVIRLAREIAIL